MPIVKMIKLIFFSLLIVQSVFAFSRSDKKLQLEYNAAKKAMELARDQFNRDNFDGKSAAQISNSKRNLDNATARFDKVVKEMKAATSKTNNALVKDLSSNPAFVGTVESNAYLGRVTKDLIRQEEKRANRAYSDCKQKYKEDEAFQNLKGSEQTNKILECRNDVRKDVEVKIAELKRTENGIQHSDVFNGNNSKLFTQADSAEKKLKNDLAIAENKQKVACSVPSSAECQDATKVVESYNSQLQESKEDKGRRPIDCNSKNVIQDNDYNVRHIVDGNGLVQKIYDAAKRCTGLDFSGNEGERQQRLALLECAQAKAKKIQLYVILAECEESGMGTKKGCNFSEILKEVDKSLGSVKRPFYIYGSSETMDCRKILGGDNV